MIVKRCVLSFLLFALGGGPVSAADGVKAVEDTLRAYEQAWSHLDAHAAASFYYEPAMRVTNGGPVIRATRSDQEVFFNGFLPALAKAGYTRSALEELQVRLLDPNTAIASGVTVRYRADGSVFARVGVTYGLWRTSEGWKIFLSATHGPDTVLRFR
jgi:ketosteroid isomerase-like protein